MGGPCRVLRDRAPSQCPSVVAPSVASIGMEPEAKIELKISVVVPKSGSRVGDLVGRRRACVLAERR